MNACLRIIGAVSVLQLCTAEPAIAQKPHLAPAIAAPQIECIISLKTWCIATFDGRIDLKDEGRSRIWSLQDRLYMKDGPLLIVESEKNCSRMHPLHVRKQSEQQSDLYTTVVFSLTDEVGCNLEFRLPMHAGTLSNDYRHAMDYQIMVGGQQLYKFENAE